MRKNGIVKMVVSAVVATCMAVIPVQAEENAAESRESEEGNNEKTMMEIREESCEKAWGTDKKGAGESGEEPETFPEDAPGPERTGPGWEPEDGAGENPESGEDNGAASPECGTEASREACGEAEFTALGELAGEEIFKEMTEVEKILYRKANYGPHMLLVKKETETEPEPEPLSYTEEDLYVLAHAICGEGQGYPDEEQLYIGSVILNRRAHGAYPDTIRGVVFQKGQYACTWDGNYYREPTAANWNNARWLLENGSVLPGNVVYQAGFRQGSGLYVQTRYHKYCYR